MGTRVWEEIDHAIRLYDKLIAVCSAASLELPGELPASPVVREIGRALIREDRERKHVLFPIRLDDYIFEGWGHPRKADVVGKVVGDFRTWRDEGPYRGSLNRLIQELRRD